MESAPNSRAGVTCDHLNQLVDSLGAELWTDKESLSCMECGCEGPNLWLCLRPECRHVGCSEFNNDHSTLHQKAVPSHCVHMNVSTERVWCYACEREVHASAAATAGAPPAAQVCEASIGGAGAGALERSAGLNVGPDDDDEDAQLDRDEARPRGLVGLQNIGNTCYMNAALQALSNARPLTEYFLDCSAVSVLAQNKKPALSRAYQKLVREMWQRRRRGCVVPSGVLYGMRSVHATFRGYHQHDAQEFLRCFMDRLHEELKEPVRECEERYAGDADGDRQLAARTLVQIRQRAASSGATDAPTFFRVRRKSPAPSTLSESRADGYFRMHTLSESEGLEQGRANRHRRSASFAGTQQANYTPLLSGGRCGAAAEGARGGGSESELSGSEAEERYETCSSGGGSDSPEPRADRHPQRDAGGCGDSTGVRYRSIISDVFDGKLLSSVQCLICDRVSTRVETFQDLSLPIPSREHMAVLRAQHAPPHPAAHHAASAAATAQDSWMWWLLSWVRSWFYGPVVSLQDCLAAFFSADELKGDNMYSCSRCNKLRNGVKMSGVVRLPEVLCVHLKRFRHELMFSAKIGARVSFPLHDLNMAPYLHKECSSKITRYELCAVICHAGTAGGGHYTCIARNGRSWYEFDDQCVTQVPKQAVAAAEAYVLFYRKVNPQMSLLRQRAAEILEASRSEPNDMKFYISKQWINKFNAWAEPGAIDNSDFVCAHGGVRPERAAYVHLLAAVVPQQLWEFLHRKFGGGPACTHVHECGACARAAERLRARRARELRAFYELHAAFQEQENPHSIYAISMHWFRQWQAFVRDKSQQPPPPVDNTGILTKQESSDPSVAPTYVLKQASDHAQLSEELWRFFTDIYGGGPEVRLKSPASEPTYPPVSHQYRERTPSLEARWKPSESDKEDYCVKSTSDNHINRIQQDTREKNTQSLQNIDRYRVNSVRASAESDEEYRIRRVRRVSQRNGNYSEDEMDTSPVRCVQNGIDSDHNCSSDERPGKLQAVAMETGPDDLPDLDSISLKGKKSGKVRRVKRRTVK